MCAHNEEETIERTLVSLKKQNRISSCEIILVDNLCEDRTREVAKLYADRVCVSPIRGKIPSLRIGVASCSGDIVVIADADTVYEPDWLSTIDLAFTANPHATIVYGPSYLGQSQSKYNKVLSQLFAWISLRCGVVNSVGYNMAIRKEALLNILSKIQPFAFSGWAIGTQALRDYGRRAVIYVPHMVVPKCTRRINRIGYFKSMSRWITEWSRLASGGELSLKEKDYYGFDNDSES